MNRAGFTLIEMLTVLAILGVLLALGIPNVMNDLRKQRLAMGTQDVVASITNARTRARSHNVCYRLTFGAQRDYLLERFTTPDCSGTVASSNTVPYAAGMILTQVNTTATSSTSTSGTSVTFISPFGTNGTGVPLDLLFTSTAKSSLTKQLRVTGALGTVIMQ